ncbi:MAG: MarR family transcriptional regulator [Spirochaetales bacterium]|nr:MarR family transcriptional regulator [Spirochaetales bacterium]
MEKIKYGDESDMNLKLMIALLRSMQHLRKGEMENISAAGLTISQFGVLEMLYHKGDLRICEIIEKTLSTGGNMTVVVANLVKEGLVLRRKDPDDGRASVLSLSEKGREKMAALFPIHVETLDRLYSPLKMEEKEVLLGLLKKLTGRE